MNPLRIPLKIPVRFGTDGTPYSEHAVNVSTGGMFLQTHQYWKPGSELNLEFSLLGDDTIVARARVIWVSEGVAGNQASFARGVGLQFIQLPQVARQQLKNLAAEYRGFP